VSQSNGALTALSGNVSTDIGDMTSDWRSSSFSLWGIDITNNELVSYNPVTGQELARTAVQNTRGAIVSIAFDVVTGVLFGNTTDVYSGSSLLYTIDTGSGATNLVGGLQYSEIYALGFDLTGKLYGIDDVTGSFLEIDTTNASATLIATLNYRSFDLAFRPGDGALFAVNSSSGNLATVDVATGVATDRGILGQNIVGLAFSPVPEPGTFVLAGLGLAAVALIRRRKA
jgi:hypothetical protein